MKPIRSLRRKALLATASVLLSLATPPQADASEQWGEVHFPISCRADLQGEFDRAVATLHSFSFAEAAKTFTAIADADPECGMAYWGLATTAMGSLFAGRTGPAALGRGSEYVRKAKALGAKTQRERDYIAAAEAFYAGADNVDQSWRVRAYADALEKIHRAYPDDPEAEIFYGYAVTALAPPTDQTYAYELKGAAILEHAFAKHPNHPGVMHYLIHAYDHTPLAPRGLEAARRYAAVAPSAPHALHIPSHIFMRLGLWQEAIDSNRAAEKVGDLFYKLHAMDSLLYSYAQIGDDAKAKGVLDELTSIRSVGIDHFNVAYSLAAMPSRYAIERRRWDEAARLALPVPDYAWNRYPHAEAVLVAARALGAARSGDAEAAKRDLIRLERLREVFAAKPEGDRYKDYWAAQMEIDYEVVSAWLAYGRGEREAAVRMLQAAADREAESEKDPIVPGAIVSARTLLGEMLLDMNEPLQALQAFEAALKDEPARFWSLYGAAKAAGLAGSLDKAAAYYARLVDQAGDAGSRAAVENARKFLARNADSTNRKGPAPD